MNIQLVKNGIFPLIYDRNGKPISAKPNTGFDFPGTIQGEGKLAGIPSLFIRTAGCNLRCTWKNDSGTVDICDTPYSSHHVHETEDYEIEFLVELVMANLGEIRHVVITGGEPALQPRPLLALATALKKKTGVHISLETNGTIYVPELSGLIDLFSISPKLRSSTPDKEKNRSLIIPVEEKLMVEHQRTRRNLDAIRKYIHACVITQSYYGDEPDREPVRRNDKDFQLKFVVSSAADEKEIKEDYLAQLGFVKNEDVLIMPLGSNAHILKESSRLAAGMAIRNGWRFAQRLQIELFGDMAGT